MSFPITVVRVCVPDIVFAKPEFILTFLAVTLCYLAKLNMCRDNITLQNICSISFHTSPFCCSINEMSPGESVFNRHNFKWRRHFRICSKKLNSIFYRLFTHITSTSGALCRVWNNPTDTTALGREARTRLYN